ncbi:MAG TPA: Bcr/CflA family multidrug efflux MFS transporter [Stellaceae bacterium]|nr:Bcr/CflA family multidrug efflux MFS transporter [Stellaceae bacterium]
MDAEPLAPAPRVVIADRRLFVLVLGALSMMAPLSHDMYLPALPGIGRTLGIDEATTVATLSAFVIGFAVGQLIWGPVGDRFGRRGPIVVGLLLYVAASFACANAGSGAALVGCRFIQAIGGCAPVVLAQAMVRDAYERRDGAHVLSLMLLVGNIAPLLAPTIGGAILVWLGWRSIFLALGLFGAFSLLGLVLLPETLPPERRHPRPRRDLVLGYLSLFGHRRYLGYLLTAGCYGGAFFSWLAGSSFVFIGYYHVPVQYFGFVFSGGVVAMMAANFLNRALIRRLDPDHVLRFGLAIASLAGLASIAVASHPEGRLWLMAPVLWIFVGSQALIGPNATAGALADFPDRAGMAAALLGATRSGCGAVGGMCVGWFADGTPWPTAAVIGSLSAAALVSNLLFIRTRPPGQA